MLIGITEYTLSHTYKRTHSTHTQTHKHTHANTHTHTHIYIFLFLTHTHIYIYYHQQTVSLYHDYSDYSVWLDTWDASSWNWNTAGLSQSDILPMNYSLSISEGIFQIYFHIHLSATRGFSSWEELCIYNYVATGNVCVCVCKKKKMNEKYILV